MQQQLPAVFAPAGSVENRRHVVVVVRTHRVDSPRRRVHPPPPLRVERTPRVVVERGCRRVRSECGRFRTGAGKKRRRERRAHAAKRPHHPLLNPGRSLRSPLTTLAPLVAFRLRVRCELCRFGDDVAPLRFGRGGLGRDPRRGRRRVVFEPRRHGSHGRLRGTHLVGTRDHLAAGLVHQHRVAVASHDFAVQRKLGGVAGPVGE